MYIGFAYKLTPAQSQLMASQLPKWATADRFDIEARAQGSPTRNQMRLMMQSLLADRFKLVVHTETRQLPVLAAVLEKAGKTGPRLVRLSDDMPCGVLTPPAAGVAPPPAKYDGWFTPCGEVELRFVSGRVRVGSQNITIEQLAGMLSVIFARGFGPRPARYWIRPALAENSISLWSLRPIPMGQPKPCRISSLTLQDQRFWRL